MDGDRSFEVGAEIATGANAEEMILLNLSSATSEMSIWLTHGDAAAILSSVPVGRAVTALTAGTSADARVHWTLDAAGRLYVVVGEDDECWDFGVTLTSADYAAVKEEVKKCLSSASTG